MRRHRPERPSAIGFLGRELRWMALGVTTLVVLFVLISRLREESQTRNAAGPQVDDHPASAAAIAKLPQPTGPTDEDEEEAEAASGDFQALSDGTLTLGPEEMPAYNRLVSWVNSQAFARLWARGKKNLAYTYLYDDAPRHRGTLVALDVEIRLVRDAGKNDAGVPLYEAWATTRESGSHFYDLIVVDFPTKMPIGVPIKEKAQFAGYFLKVQGYEPAAAKPGGPHERAPLLVGRLDWKPAAAPAETGIGQEWLWAIVGLACLVLVWGATIVFRWLGKAKTSRCTLTPPADGVIPVEDWLEQCTDNSQEEPEDRKTEDGPAAEPP